MITDELRAWWVHKFPVVDKELHKDFTAIADRIDAAHRAALEKLAAGADDDHDGWVELPKDADGVPIHVGDEVTCGGSVWQVTGLRLTGGFWGVCCTIFNDQGGSGTNVYPPSDLHHHRPDTWERIIEDATALGAQMGRRTTQVDDLVARCKALCERTKEVGE